MTMANHQTGTMSQLATVLPGLCLTLGIAAAAIALREMTGIAVLSPMIAAVLAGLVIGTVWRPPAALLPGIALATRPLLRLGIILLGFQITLQQIAALGAGAAAVSVLTLATTFVAIRLMGPLLGVPAPLTGLIAAGTAVCGASAVLAANAVARGSQEDVAYSIACVTVFGTIAMLGAPLVAAALGLEGAGFGIWVGATVHEVAQVTAAAFQLGPEAGQAGTVAKLTRVVMLAPLVLAMTWFARAPGDAVSAVPVPWFVFGFVAAMGFNSLVDVPAAATSLAAFAATLLLSGGLAAMGLMINIGRLKAKGIRPLLLGAFGSVFAAAVGYGLLRLLVV